MLLRMNRLVVVGVLALTACGGRIAPEDDPGDAGGPNPPTVDAATNTPEASTPEASTPDASGSVRASCGTGSRYRGTIDAFKFPDGSSTIEMTFDLQGNGFPPSGSVYFGAAPPLAPPTSFDVGYPPGFPPPEVSWTKLVESFCFNLGTGVATASSAHFVVNRYEVWKTWCEGQKSVPWLNGGTGTNACGPQIGYACLPNAATEYDNLENPTWCKMAPCGTTTFVPVDCGKLRLCETPSPPCACTGSGCTEANGPITFDLEITPGHLDGTVIGIELAPTTHTIHLTQE
jgi:hypothetical protein